SSLPVETIEGGVAALTQSSHKGHRTSRILRAPSTPRGRAKLARDQRVPVGDSHLAAGAPPVGPRSTAGALLVLVGAAELGRAHVDDDALATLAVGEAIGPGALEATRALLARLLEVGARARVARGGRARTGRDAAGADRGGDVAGEGRVAAGAD